MGGCQGPHPPWLHGGPGLGDKRGGVLRAAAAGCCGRGHPGFAAAVSRGDSPANSESQVRRRAAGCGSGQPLREQTPSENAPPRRVSFPTPGRFGGDGGYPESPNICSASSSSGPENKQFSRKWNPMPAWNPMSAWNREAKASVFQLQLPVPTQRSLRPTCRPEEITEHPLRDN